MIVYKNKIADSNYLNIFTASPNLANYYGSSWLSVCIVKCPGTLILVALKVLEVWWCITVWCPEMSCPLFPSTPHKYQMSCPFFPPLPTNIKWVVLFFPPLPTNIKWVVLFVLPLPSNIIWVALFLPPLRTNIKWVAFFFLPHNYQIKRQDANQRWCANRIIKLWFPWRINEYDELEYFIELIKVDPHI